MLHLPLLLVLRQVRFRSHRGTPWSHRGFLYQGGYFLLNSDFDAIQADATFSPLFRGLVSSGEEMIFPPGMMKAFRTCAYDLSIHGRVKRDEAISSFQLTSGTRVRSAGVFRGVSYVSLRPSTFTYCASDLLMRASC